MAIDSKINDYIWRVSKERTGKIGNPIWHSFIKQEGYSVCDFYNKNRATTNTLVLDMVTDAVDCYEF